MFGSWIIMDKSLAESLTVYTAILRDANKWASTTDFHCSRVDLIILPWNRSPEWLGATVSYTIKFVMQVLF